MNFKKEINVRTILGLTIVILYLNILRPFSIYKILSPLCDVFIFLIICKHLLKNGIQKNKIPFFLMVTYFMLLTAFQMLNPNIPEISAGILGFRKTALPFLMFYLGLFSFSKAKDVEYFLKQISLWSIPILLYGVKQHFFSSNFDNLYIYSNNANMYTGLLFNQIRSVSIFAGPFHYGLFSAVIAVISLYMIDNVYAKKYKFFYIALFILSLIACYSSLTRTNLICLIVGVFVYKILTMKTTKALIILWLFGISSIFIFNYINNNSYKLLYSQNELIKMIGTILNYDEDSRLLGRTTGWSTGLELLKEHPIIGYGTGSAGDTLQYNYFFEHHITSHNFLLKVFFETGIFGLLLIIILFLFISIMMLHRISKTKSKEYKRNITISFSILIIFLVNGIVATAIDTYPVSNLMLLIMPMGINVESQ